MPNYNALKKNQIRLLILEPGQPGDDIKCRLVVESLNDIPPYEALSSVWGDENDVCEIKVDGAPLNITRNLFTALKCFRRGTHERALWADAICTNQGNIDERGCQVALMRRIYSQCYTCQVWLGDYGDIVPLPISKDVLPSWDTIIDLAKNNLSGEKSLIDQCIRSVDPPDVRTLISCLSVYGAFNLLSDLASGRHIFNIPIYHHAEFPDYDHFYNFHASLRSLVNICSRSWWTRTWTAQEAILPQLVMVNIGRHKIVLDAFLRAANHLEKHQRECFRCADCVTRLWDLPLKSSRPMEPTLGQAMKKITVLHRAIQIAGNGVKGNMNVLRQHTIHKKLLALERETTDPRDRIYGYIGLLPTIWPHAEQPSYQKDAAWVYATATKWLIHNEGTLTALLDVQPTLRPTKGLASWANNWEAQRLGLYASTAEAYGAYRAYNNPKLFANDEILPVEITIIGHVNVTIPFRGVWWDWIQTVPTNVTLRDTISEYGKVSETSNHLSLEPGFEEVNLQIQVGYREHDDERKLFCTLDTGYIGILPGGVEPGDTIAVARGLRYPMILRQAAK